MNKKKNNEKNKKTDRRSIYTRNVIKNALLELTATTPYAKMNVTRLCKQADIARTTFYLHYDHLDEVLDEVIDDALQFSERAPGTIVDVLSAFQNGNPQKLKEKESLLPACQRIADSDKYHSLFMDHSVSNRILQRIAAYEKENVLPHLMHQSHLSESEAEMLFRFILNGTFAVNRSLGWQKNERWYRYQQILSRFINAGLNDAKR